MLLGELEQLAESYKAISREAVAHSDNGAIHFHHIMGHLSQGLSAGVRRLRQDPGNDDFIDAVLDYKRALHIYCRLLARHEDFRTHEYSMEKPFFADLSSLGDNGPLQYVKEAAKRLTAKPALVGHKVY